MMRSRESRLREFYLAFFFFLEKKKRCKLESKKGKKNRGIIGFIVHDT